MWQSICLQQLGVSVGPCASRGLQGVMSPGPLAAERSWDEEKGTQSLGSLAPTQYPEWVTIFPLASGEGEGLRESYHVMVPLIKFPASKKRKKKKNRTWKGFHTKTNIFKFYFSMDFVMYPQTLKKLLIVKYELYKKCWLWWQKFVTNIIYHYRNIYF